MAVETHVLDDDCETITGWGRTAPTLARVNRPRTHAEAAEAVRTAGARGSIAPYVTVGGAIAADVHGTNHPTDGSFGRHVTALDTERARDLDDLMARLTAADHRYRYSVARIALLARGAATGRGVLTRGDHAPYEALPRRHRARRAPLAFRPLRLPAPPPYVPGGLLGRTTAGLFNELWYRSAPRAGTGRLQSLNAFFHPLDGVPHRNRIHGRAGSVPRLDEFRALRAALDPRSVLTSDLSRRLGLQSDPISRSLT
ncbi:hypothetical protein [Streptomyces sp. NBC_00572]|uniref:hypothetical protein n=1 Tax=Streptomyces sp. NBC_00572 TaxID=2903664 RepID=UPI0022523097|nr:hypothetical protein [Streptomyces sp. NBC_00572]MCX4982972.1 hypothetical protein [Streptomyces sp. NBC_00572]